MKYIILIVLLLTMAMASKVAAQITEEEANDLYDRMAEECLGMLEFEFTLEYLGCMLEAK